VTVFRSRSADFCFPLPRLLALPTEAWRGAEICRCSGENSYVNLPGPLGVYKSCVQLSMILIFFKFFIDFSGSTATSLVTTTPATVPVPARPPRRTCTLTSRGPGTLSERDMVRNLT
jgi:hypothetical protein